MRMVWLRRQVDAGTHRARPPHRRDRTRARTGAGRADRQRRAHPAAHSGGRRRVARPVLTRTVRSISAKIEPGILLPRPIEMGRGRTFTTTNPPQAAQHAPSPAANHHASTIGDPPTSTMSRRTLAGGAALVFAPTPPPWSQTSTGSTLFSVRTQT